MNTFEKIINKTYVCKNCGKTITEEDEIRQYLECESCDACISKIEREYFK